MFTSGAVLLRLGGETHRGLHPAGIHLRFGNMTAYGSDGDPTYQGMNRFYFGGTPDALAAFFVNDPRNVLSRSAKLAFQVVDSGLRLSQPLHVSAVLADLRCV
jgi:hypothetical protein